MDPSYSPGAPEPQNVHELLNLYDQKSSRSVAPKKSFLLLVAGAVVLILIIFFLFLRSRGGDNTASVESVLSAQQAILTTLDQSSKDIRGRTTLNFATRVQAVITSDQSSLLSAANSTKKISTKVYKGSKDTNGLAKIKQATVGNQYDDVLTGVIASEIADYQTKLKNAYDTAKNTKVKTSLSEAYTHTSSLKP